MRELPSRARQAAKRLGLAAVLVLFQRRIAVELKELYL